MADVTELRCWPSCVDALDWSQDGIIALASDERVELLFPNTVSYDRDQEVAQWRHIPLQVPLFTSEELPIKEPATLANYSIGEEISSSAPIAIAWSPPGIAKHRRCALAALTANLILSIWSADDKQDEGKSWDRRVIVNVALTTYFSTITADELSGVEEDPNEGMRLRTRIRAFTWAPALPTSQSSSSLGSRLSYGPHLMAVCNDDNQLALVVIKSPASTNGAEVGWSTEVLAHISLTPNPRSNVTTSASFDDRLKQQRHISHVAWSPWVLQDDSYRSIIAYTTNEDVRARLITYAKTKFDISNEHVYSRTEAQHNGRLEWCPVVNAGVLTLAVFDTSGLVLLGISLQDASIKKLSDHDLDGRWDAVTGAVWDTVNRSVPRLHFSSMLSTTHSPTAVLEASSAMLLPIGLPSWRDQIENSAVLFSAKNDLKGNTKTKVWGLAISPLGDFLATCHSVHPSDMIEYGSTNDRRGTVAISGLRQYRDILLSFPARDVSAEGVLFTLKKLVENTLEDNDQMPAFSEQIAAKLFEAYGPMQGADVEIKVSSLSMAKELDSVVQALKRNVFFDSETLKDRYAILVSHACDKNSTAVLQRLLIAYRLSNALQELPEDLCATPFSSEIRAHHRKLITLVRSLLGQDLDPQPQQPASATETDAGQIDIEAGSEFEGPNKSSLTEHVNLNMGDATVDSCDFCSAPILFNDPSTASCTNGHEFPRCGLSLIAIQAPGISKYCGICNTPYLNEEFVVAQEVNEPAGTSQNSNAGDGEEARGSKGDIGRHRLSTGQGNGRGNSSLLVTLARVLFLACDVCIYCGGKFVG
ncbi:transcription factor IIIC subunit delta N-term-domain-containing protein [Phaeosphaeria sp. MPI-PUGE-AT-0046c]|nr:transcription factor IIIC subunit delta N-term-domain-containing protein [Phaeosphaeria sp. MPI-PUGE-AT-0046c]